MRLHQVESLCTFIYLLVFTNVVDSWNFYIYNSRNSGSVIVITLKLFSCISMHFEKKIADRSPKELPYFSETKRYVNTIKI